MRVQTDGSGAAGEPWRALRVLYWHPGREDVCLFGLSPFMRGVSEGTMRFEGETADAVYNLYQAGLRREMGLRWTFDGPDQYHETLLESVGAAGLTPLNELDFVRSKTLTCTGPRSDERAPKLSLQLKAFEALVGHTWEAKGGRATGGSIHIQSTLQWVPYADFIYARSVALTEDGEDEHLLDAYFYYHNGTDALHCLALSAWGGVHEGVVSVIEGGALQFDLTSYAGDGVVTHVVRFDIQQDGTLRNRIWSLDSTERALMLDVRHKKLEPRKS
jgi:hypothetical protein